MLIKENFTPAGKSFLDTKHRVTIGKVLNKNIATTLRDKIDSFDVFVGDSGDILLRPLSSVPAREAWVYNNPKVSAKIKKGLDSARKGELVRIDDIDEFVDKL
jgi:hypothetical protein